MAVITQGYIVRGRTTAHDEMIEWNVCVFDDHQQALDHIKTLTLMAADFIDRYKLGLRPYPFWMPDENPLDPNGFILNWLDPHIEYFTEETTYYKTK